MRILNSVVSRCIIRKVDAVAANDGGVNPPVYLPPVLTEEGIQFVRKSVDVIYALMRLFGFDDEGVKKKGTYDHWIACARKVGCPVKFVKWKISAFYAFHKSDLTETQQLPPSVLVKGEDNPGCLVGGRGYKFLCLMRNRDPLMWENFITSVLYSKKGMPRPYKKILEASARATFKTLTTKIPEVISNEFLVSWADAEKLPHEVEYFLSQKSMTAQLQRTVREIFDEEKYLLADRIQPFFPSTSANYNRTRSQAGTLGEIFNHPTILQGLQSSEPVIKFIDGSKVSEVIDQPRTDQSFSSDPYKNTTKVKRVEYGGVMVDLSDLEEKFAMLYHRMVGEALKEPPLVDLVMLPEALKVRGISKGPAFHYAVLKPLQKKLWSTMKKIHVFHLIGKPVTADIVQERLGAKLGPGEKYLSVDYSDATNQMYSWVSEVIVREICVILDIVGDEARLVEESMTKHLITDPDDKDHILPQNNGQLMGSIISFPILCIANAAICRWMLELSNLRKIPLRDANLAINGDDAVMRCTEEGRLLWEKIGSFCGLRPSVGKVYFSSRFLNINSTTYNYHQDGYESFTTKRLKYSTDEDTGRVTQECKITHRMRHFELVKYVNLGLLFGLKRSGGKTELDTEMGGTTLGVCAQDLIASSPHYLHETLMSQYLWLNDKVLKTFAVPWFLPESLCGLGLPSVGRFCPTKFDLQVARKIAENPDVFRVPKLRTLVPWKVWNWASDQIPKFVSSAMMNIRDVDSVQRGISRKRIISLFCVASLFQAKLDSIYSEGGLLEINQEKSLKYFRATERTWAKARKDQTIPLRGPIHIRKLLNVDFDDIPVLQVLQKTHFPMLMSV